jgi:hypothetical protein
VGGFVGAEALDGMGGWISGEEVNTLVFLPFGSTHMQFVQFSLHTFRGLGAIRISVAEIRHISDFGDIGSDLYMSLIHLIFIEFNVSEKRLTHTIPSSTSLHAFLISSSISLLKPPPTPTASGRAP